MKSLHFNTIGVVTVSNMNFQAVTWEAHDELVQRCSSDKKVDEDDDDDIFDCDDASGDGVHTIREELPKHIGCVFVACIFGRDMDGNCMKVKVHNFKPFFFIKVDRALLPFELKEVKLFLSRIIRKDCRSENCQVIVENVCLKDIWGFQNGQLSNFVQVSLYRYGAMKKVHRIFPEHPEKPKCIEDSLLYESNLDPVLRLIHVRDLPSAGWIKFDKFYYDNIENVYHVDFKRLHAVADSDNLRTKIPVAAFDIECFSKSGNFPIASLNCLSIAEEFVEMYVQYTANERFGFKCIQDFLNKSKRLKRYVVSDENSEELARKLFSYIRRIIEYPVSIQTLKDEVERMLIQYSSIDGDPVVQIGTTIHNYGDDPGVFHFKHIVTLGQCDDIVDTDVTLVRASSEKDLFIIWAKMIRDKDPDMITGYNIFGFDMPYMYKRMVRWNVFDEVMKIISREGAVHPATFVRKVLTSSALGDNDLNYFEVPGRTCFDLMKIVQRDYKLDSYKLDSVAEHFTGERKHDVSPNEIFAAWTSNSKECLSERARVASYCVQDCVLCNVLVSKLNIVCNTAAMATVCSVPTKMIHMRGQGIKLQSLVFKQCRTEGACFPCISTAPAPEQMQFDAMECVKYTDISTQCLKKGYLIPGLSTKYDGATVLTPVPGIYTDPVCVNDFASLYPSSMISENISHDTLVMDEKYNNLPGVSYVDIEFNEGSSSISCRYAQEPEGILPRILKYLLKARKDTRNRAKFVKVMEGARTLYVGPKKDAPMLSDGQELIDAFDEFQKQVLDGMQLAYKVVSNSCYGQCGASTSPIYLKPLAACTTATGRAMLKKARNFIETHVQGKCIQGDTDSLFYTIPIPSHITDMPPEKIRAYAMETAMSASREFKKMVKEPHDFEAECLYHPLVAFAKKRYAAIKYDSDMAKGKMKSMGIVLKRRDNAPILKEIYGTALDIILKSLNVKQAIDYVNMRLQELANGVDVDIKSLIVTKTLKKEYKNPETIAHKVLADRVALREPGNAFQCNDRVPYVHIKSSAKLVGDRIETPDYVLANPDTCKIDYDYYITNQICKPMCQLMGLVVEQLPGFYHSHDYFSTELNRRIENKMSLMSRTRWTEEGGKVMEDAIASIQDEKEKYAKRLIFDKLTTKSQKVVTDFFPKRKFIAA